MKTFKIGGVHPAENKLSATSPIRPAALPKQAVFSMFQHIGAPAQAIVKIGEQVTAGQMIAKPAQGLSVAIHASISGVVLDVTDRAIVIEAK